MEVGLLWDNLRELFQKLTPRAGRPRMDFEALFSELTHAATDNLEKMHTDIYAPCDYLISLSRRDMDDLDQKGLRALLQRSLQKALRDYVREKGYMTQEPVTVRLESHPGLDTGFIGVTVKFLAHDPKKPDAQTVIRPPQGKALAVFEVMDGPQKGQMLPLTRFPAEIGRIAPSHHPEVGLEDDKRWIGRHHARVEQRGSEFFLVDTNSENGTELDGKRLLPDVRTPLKEGAVVSLAERFTLQFHIGDRSVSVGWTYGT